MADKDTIFVLTREDAIDCAGEMGIPEEAITDDVLRSVIHRLLNVEEKPKKQSKKQKVAVAV